MLLFNMACLYEYMILGGDRLHVYMILGGVVRVHDSWWGCTCTLFLVGLYVYMILGGDRTCSNCPPNLM